MRIYYDYLAYSNHDSLGLVDCDMMVWPQIDISTQLFIGGTEHNGSTQTELYAHLYINWNTTDLTSAYT